MSSVNGNIIKGKQEICRAVQRSWKIVRRWIAEDGFPATKIDGVWESHPQLIDEWRRRRIWAGRAAQG
jgi:hypothetical protein